MKNHSSMILPLLSISYMYGQKHHTMFTAALRNERFLTAANKGRFHFSATHLSFHTHIVLTMFSPDWRGTQKVSMRSDFCLKIVLTTWLYRYSNATISGGPHTYQLLGNEGLEK